MSDSGQQTFIGRGIRIKGEITGSAPIEVRGAVEGSAGTEGMLRVHEGGRVEGEIAAKNVVIEGQVEGQVAAEERIELTATCKVHGDLSSRSLAVTDGALFEGKVQMRR